MKSRTFPSIVVLSILAACADPIAAPDASGLRITTDRSIYASGDTVQATLTNAGAASIGYELCGFAFERRASSGEWEAAPSATGGVACIAMILTLAPSASARISIPLATSISGGAYRARFDRITDARGRELSRSSRTTPAFAITTRDAASGQPPDSIARLYWRDANALAIRELRKGKAPEAQEIEVPIDLIQRFYETLVAVYRSTAIAARDSVVSLYGIHTFPEAQELIVGVDPSVAWTRAWAAGRLTTGNAAIDAIVERYGLTLRHYYPWTSGPAAVLGRTWTLNVTALATRLEGIDGVRYAEPDGYGGDGSDIAAERTPGGWKLDFSLGFGDCPVGCTSRHYWTFLIDDTGHVSFLGSRGSPAPAPHG